MVIQSFPHPQPRKKISIRFAIDKLFLCAKYQFFTLLEEKITYLQRGVELDVKKVGRTKEI